MTDVSSTFIIRSRDSRSCTAIACVIVALAASCATAQTPALSTEKPADQAPSTAGATDSDEKPEQESGEQASGGSLAEKLSVMKQELERLRLESELIQQRQAQQLQQLQLEKSKLEAELSLANARETSLTAPDRTKIEALQRAQKLRDAQLAEDLSAAMSDQARMKQLVDVENAKLQVELAKSKADLERLRVAEEVLDSANKSKLAGMRREQEQLAAANSLAAEMRRAEQSKIADEQMRASAASTTIGAQIQTRELEDKWRDAVNAPITYTKEPFKDGILVVSDRRIDLNGPIVSGTADAVCSRIDYFNNQDRTLPIFIVITNSPGGSVQQGYRILKAVETSDAPVHVLVKSFAASMAATIATLAPHSYAFPNAIILHHQMSGGASGNMTNMEQELTTMQEWERRLAEPIAKKMGVSLSKFKEMMYTAKKSGDWDEFADKALQLKWIDHIVSEVREEGVRKKPAESSGGGWWMSSQKRDENGQPYVELPALEPYDCYFMINPRGFYRIDGR